MAEAKSPASASGPQSDLVPYTGYAIAQQGTEGFLDVLRENVGTGALTAFDLERVKFPTSGGRHWSVPTLDGEPDDLRALDGIIVYHREPRAYWQVAFELSGGGTPPDCASQHGDVGLGTPGGDCSRCPMAAWGSAPNKPGARSESRGQACKQMKLVFLLRPEALLPLAIFLPPTSMRAIRQYLLGLASRAQHYSSVLTRLELETTKNADGIEYSVVRPRRLASLDAAEAGRVREYAEAIRSTLDTISITAEDLPEPTDPQQS